MPHECRAELFRERGFEVLGSVVQGTQIAQPDPFDVDEIHADARAAFDETLRQVRAGPAGKILLIRGEAGCGKTHLIRSLRNRTHRLGHGVIAYVHMTSELGDYRQYLLRQVVRSLNDPLLPSANGAAGPGALDRVSDALMQIAGYDDARAEAFREASGEALARQIDDCADALAEATDASARPRFDGVDLNTLRVLLYRQSLQTPIRRRVSSFLNGEPMSPADWEKLSALPRDCDRGPMYLLGQLARVTLAATGMPLVVCVDQIEASDITGRNHDPFLNAMGAACELIENVPGVMVVLSCLDSAYNVHAPHLIQAYRHRIENDPAPVLLAAARGAQDVRWIVSRRLRLLYESEGLVHVPPDSVFPLPEDVPERLQGQHVRTVLQTVHAYWQKCNRAAPGTMPEWDADAPATAAQLRTDDVDADRLRVAWNEFSTSGQYGTGDDEREQFDLLMWAMADAGAEMDEGTTVSVARVSPPDGGSPTPCLAVTIRQPRTEPQARLVGLCDKDPRGGGLDRQVRSLESCRQDDRQIIVVLRGTPFPKTGKTADRIATLRQSGHRTAVLESSTWQSLGAMRAFVSGKAREFPPAVVRNWRRSDRPLTGQSGVTTIFEPSKPAGFQIPAATDRTPPAAHTSNASAAPVAPPQRDARSTPSSPPRPVLRESDGVRVPSSSSQKTPAPPAPLTPLLIGRTEGFNPADVTLDPQVLTRHSAVLGANGSGKTVLALTIVERLLERGIPAILFDRKGDLASYAVEEAWSQPTGAPDERARRDALRSRVEVNLYTPGSAAGRPLVLPLLPDGLGKLDPEQRIEQVRQAAWILTDVCQPPKSKTDTFATVLTKSVELLCGGDASRSLDDLQELLLQPPGELMDLLPAHQPKDCVAVGRRLNERRVAHGRLFDDAGEKLDLARMLAPADGGRTRLNVVSTQFLDGDSALIWVAQFLAAAGRHILSAPFEGGRLGAVLMFDEADQYIPANRKPATKPGMENLLRRARAAGVGLLLASQNVGDFDYKALDNITTLFAGKLTTPRALKKLRSRFASTVERLPTRRAGQFVMGIDGSVREIRADMSLVKPVQIPRETVERLAAAQRPA